MRNSHGLSDPGTGDGHPPAARIHGTDVAFCPTFRCSAVDTVRRSSTVFSKSVREYVEHDGLVIEELSQEIQEGASICICWVESLLPARPATPDGVAPGLTYVTAI
jgi:hypothetical protein